MYKKIIPFMFSLIFVLAATACVPPGTESYYASQYETDSEQFDIQLHVIQSNTPAPKESTLLIRNKASRETGEPNMKVKIYFHVYDGSIEGQLNQTTIIDVTTIPAPLLNGLDFKAVVVYGDQKEEITFHRAKIARKHFRP
ncbi:hypothetical protein SK066_22910 [Paenibacillus hunanensis]|uniref:hypothetical protein n=1 Tax=Paenibacillus hunanensis TaxID=539262 RepID=UPI002A6B0086|nr:hypothetical protein [Paenibacillus hunanensis]WPP41368.1 hypothetical protein SK066_22910 [Paenibacillus hunanensis]